MEQKKFSIDSSTFSEVVSNTFNPSNNNEFPYPEGRLVAVYLEADGTIADGNQTFFDTVGYEKKELMGKHLNTLYHPDLSRTIIDEMWATVQAGKNWQGHMQNLRKDGLYSRFHVTMVPSINDQREVTAYTLICRKSMSPIIH